MKSKLKDILRNSKSFAYHQLHIKNAKKTLGQLEASYGKLSNNTKKDCDDYARDVFNWVGYSPWLYVYSLVSGGFKEGWIPDNYYGETVVNKLKGGYGKLSSLGASSSILFGSRYFPDLLFCVNGLIYRAGVLDVVTEKMAREKLLEFGEVVFKCADSNKGKGVRFYEKKEIEKLDFSSLGNGVFQSKIDQHEFFIKYTSKSIATIRLTTAVNDTNQVTLRAAYLRLGVGEDTHVKSSSQLRIPVDIKTGELGDIGYGADWSQLDVYPGGSVGFGGKIPSFPSCVKVVWELHTSYPMARVIGWDLIVNNRGEVEVMEWNGGHNGITFSESVQGPCFLGLGFEGLVNHGKIK